MTEQEARKKAENYADTRWGTEAQARKLSMEWDPNRYAYERQETVRAYMQCYRDMCGGEPDGYVATHSSGEYKHEAFFAGSNQMMTPIFLKPVTINVADKFLGWEFKPIKLLRVG